MQIFDEPVVMELCCGEGFYDKYFYAPISNFVCAYDLDENAIKEAKRKYAMTNISFDVLDIRENLPHDVNGKSFTNIIWDAAIAYFTPAEIDKILKNIKLILSHKKGILSGQTNFSGNRNQKFFQHKHEFTTKEEIKQFLEPYFSNVMVIETIYEDRHNFYFWASDGGIPFDKHWEHWTIN